MIDGWVGANGYTRLQACLVARAVCTLAVLNPIPTDPAEQPMATTRRLLCMPQS